MSPVHSIHRRPAHSGALFNRLPDTSPVAPSIGDRDVLIVGGVEPGQMPPGFDAAPDP